MGVFVKPPWENDENRMKTLSKLHKNCMGVLQKPPWENDENRMKIA